MLANSIDESKWRKLSEGDEESVDFIKNYALKNWGDSATFVPDNTIVGGYWANKVTGEALIILPND